MFVQSKVAFDLVLIMSVNPGFGGQKFIERTYQKVRDLKEMIECNGSETLIEVDGGVNLDNAPLLREAGVDAFVAGNTVFKAANPIETISLLKDSDKSEETEWKLGKYSSLLSQSLAY